MAVNNKQTDEESTNRRRFLTALGVASTALAGCQQQDDGSGGETTTTTAEGTDTGDGGGGGSQEMGERVPPIILTYFTGSGALDPKEKTASVIRESMETMNFPLEIKPLEISATIESIFQDLRRFDMLQSRHTLSSDRLDPHFFVRRFAIDWAGGDGKGNLCNYASCDYSVPAMEQASAPNLEERRALVNEAYSIYSEDHLCIPLKPATVFSAARSDAVDVQRAGRAGISIANPFLFIASQPTQGEGFTMATTSPQLVQTQAFPNMNTGKDLYPWTSLIHSKLTEYDENWELQEVLASSYEFSNDGQRVTVELRDATFHNGDPITAEDVQFTYNFLAEAPFPQTSQPPYESIEIVDEKTAEFNMSRPFTPLATRVWAKWPVMHKASWVDAQDDPTGYEFDPIIGSGAFKVRNYEIGNSLVLEPHDGHPLFSPEHTVTFRKFNDIQSAFQAFRQNSVQMVEGLTTGLFERVQNDLSDVATTFTTVGYLSDNLYVQHPQPPVKFPEIRQAISMGINRRRLQQILFKGLVETEIPYAGIPFTKSHPWRPPEDMLTKYTTEPAGDPEGAQQLLREQGYQWDDQGRLRYPADIDLTPLWPKGEEPSSDDFPCLDSDLFA